MYDNMLLNYFISIKYHNTVWLAPHSHMSPPNFPTSSTKTKHVIAWWIALLTMEDGECSWTFAKVINPNIIKVVANHHVLLTH